MKKTLILLITLLTASYTIQAATKDAPDSPAPRSPFSLGAYMSYWDIQAINDFDIQGALGGGVVGQFRVNPHLALEMRISGFLAGKTEDVFVPGQGWYENELTLSAVPVEAGLVGFLPLGDTFSLYGGPGIGYYFFDGEFRSTQGPVEITRDINLDDEAGFYALFGGRAQLAWNIALFAEAKYTWVESSISQTVGIFQAKEDVDFSGLALQAGMIFTF